MKRAKGRTQHRAEIRASTLRTPVAGTAETAKTRLDAAQADTHTRLATPRRPPPAAAAIAAPEADTVHAAAGVHSRHMERAV